MLIMLPYFKETLGQRHKHKINIIVINPSGCEFNFNDNCFPLRETIINIHFAFIYSLYTLANKMLNMKLTLIV